MVSVITSYYLLSSVTQFEARQKHVLNEVNCFISHNFCFQTNLKEFRDSLLASEAALIP